MPQALMFNLKAFFLLLVFSLSASVMASPANTTADPEPVLKIEDAWIAEAPPGSKVMAAYMNIRNLSADDIEIVSFESPGYSSIEAHETVYQNGIARMFRHKSIKIPAGASIRLARGGKHLMLFNPNKPLQAGDKVMITFISRNQLPQSSIITVKRPAF